MADQLGRPGDEVLHVRAVLVAARGAGAEAVGVALLRDAVADERGASFAAEPAASSRDSWVLNGNRRAVKRLR